MSYVGIHPTGRRFYVESKTMKTRACWVSVFVSVLLVTSAASCSYDASFSDCTVRCTADLECPEGLTCGGNGLCHAPGIAETCDASPSCIGLSATCGPNSDEDCCASPLVPGGMYYRSYDVSGDGMYPSMAYPATVSSFRLDRFEVTVGRFRAFVTAGQGTRTNPPMAGAGTHAKIPGSGWDPSWDAVLVPDTAALVTSLKCDPTYQTWTDAAGANENLPINCVTWYEAMAFCAWDGGFPPSENEWNYAAAGGDEQRAYPWSSPAGATAIDCTYANYDVDVPSGQHCVDGTTGGINRVGSESPKGDGKWGQADLAGNVWEWTLDWWTNASYPTPCSDCADLTTAMYRVVRGGSYHNGADLLRGGGTHGGAPRGPDAGFRCARP